MTLATRRYVALRVAEVATLGRSGNTSESLLWGGLPTVPLARPQVSPILQSR